MYGKLNDQVFYDDVHLNNRIGTRKLVTNIKHHLGLRGRNFERFESKPDGKLSTIERVIGSVNHYKHLTSLQNT